MSDQQSQSDLPDDEQLDQLLQGTIWPEADSAVIARLQSVWDDAVETSGADATELISPQPQLVRATDVSESRRGVAQHWIRMAIVLGIAVAAFAVGRWSNNGPQKESSIAESDQRQDKSPRNPDSDQKPKEPRDVGNGVPGDHPAMSDDDSKMAVSDDEPDQSLIPVPEPERSYRRGRSRSAVLRDTVDSVLVCLEKTPDSDSSCVEPLLKFRRESEYLLWQVVQNTTGQRRLAAITAIGFVGSERSVPSLIQGLNEEELRTASISAIQRCADEETLAVFIQQQQDAELAREFVSVLVQRPVSRAQPVFLNLVEQPSTRTVCLNAVKELTPQFLNSVWAALDSRRVSDRMAAVLILGARKDEATVRRIVASIRSHPTRWEPVAALMWNGSPDAIKLLNQMQRDPQLFAVMQTAAIQLQSFVGPEQQR